MINSMEQLSLEVLFDQSRTEQLARRLVAQFKPVRHLFRKQIALGSVLKKQWRQVGYFSDRPLRPLVRPYGEFVEAPLAGDGDRPDGYLLLTPHTAFWAESQLLNVAIVGCLHTVDSGEQDDKFMVIPFRKELSLQDAFGFIEQIRLVCTYLKGYKNAYRQGRYECPLKVLGFSWVGL